MLNVIKRHLESVYGDAVEKWTISIGTILRINFYNGSGVVHVWYERGKFKIKNKDKWYVLDPSSPTFLSDLQDKIEDRKREVLDMYHDNHRQRLEIVDPTLR